MGAKIMFKGKLYDLTEMVNECSNIPRTVHEFTRTEVEFITKGLELLAKDPDTNELDSDLAYIIKTRIQREFVEQAKEIEEKIKK